MGFVRPFFSFVAGKKIFGSLYNIKGENPLRLTINLESAAVQGTWVLFWLLEWIRRSFILSFSAFLLCGWLLFLFFFFLHLHSFCSLCMVYIVQVMQGYIRTWLFIIVMLRPVSFMIIVPSFICFCFTLFIEALHSPECNECNYIYYR